MSVLKDVEKCLEDLQMKLKILTSQYEKSRSKVLKDIWETRTLITKLSGAKEDDEVVTINSKGITVHKQNIKYVEDLPDSSCRVVLEHGISFKSDFSREKLYSLIQEKGNDKLRDNH